MTNRNGLYVLTILKEIGEPATKETIIETIKKSSYASEELIRKVVEPILLKGVELGFIQCIDGFYFLMPGIKLDRRTIGDNKDDASDQVEEVEHDKTFSRSSPEKTHSRQENTLSKSKSRSSSQSQCPSARRKPINEAEPRSKTSCRRPSSKSNSVKLTISDEESSTRRKPINEPALRSKTSNRRPSSKSNSVKLTMSDEESSARRKSINEPALRSKTSSRRPSSKSNSVKLTMSDEESSARRKPINEPALRSKISCRRPSSKSNSVKLTMSDEDEFECLYPITRRQARAGVKEKASKTNEGVGASQIQLEEMHIHYPEYDIQARSLKRKRNDMEDTSKTRSSRFSRQRADDYEPLFLEDSLQYDEEENFHHVKRPRYESCSSQRCANHHQYFYTCGMDDNNPIMPESSTLIDVGVKSSEEMYDGSDDEEAVCLQSLSRASPHRSRSPRRRSRSRSRGRRYN